MAIRSIVQAGYWSRVETEDMEEEIVERHNFVGKLKIIPLV